MHRMGPVWTRMDTLKDLSDYNAAGRVAIDRSVGNPTWVVPFRGSYAGPPNRSNTPDVPGESGRSQGRSARKPDQRMAAGLGSGGDTPDPLKELVRVLVRDLQVVKHDHLPVREKVVDIGS
jgi:hypothetical protein